MNLNFRKFFLFIVFIGVVAGCTNNDFSSTNPNDVVDKKKSYIPFTDIIPLPAEVKEADGEADSTFNLSDVDKIVIDLASTLITNEAEYLKEYLSQTLGKSLEIVGADTSILASLDSPLIRLSIDENLDGGKEAYQIHISPEQILLTGKTDAGVFWGIQTLKQLMPYSSDTNPILVKTGAISDYPRMEYRGFMLDAGRYFYSVTEVKEIIDHLATYKYNAFHFHLTDDQGWRIEIPSWPKLTTIGSNSAVGKSTCKDCFYTLEEYEDIVAYASARHITLIPEIDVPGHVRSVLASYKELYCDGEYPEWPYTDIRVKISSLCFSNPKIYEFFNDVISEVAARTPGEYIHVGGDETPDWVAKEDYKTFMLRAKQIVSSHGKKMMGWTDDLGSVEGLGKDVLGQHWAIKSTCCETTLSMANQGNKIVLSPANKTYLDLKYDINAPIGLEWAGYNSVENSYAWNPDTIVPGLDKSQVLGIEAALWGEKITSFQDAEYQIFPRLLTLSEVAWTPEKSRDWKAFSLRLKNQMPRLEQKEINFRSPF